MVMTMMVMMKMMKEVIPSHVILFGRNWFMLYQRIAIMMLILMNLSHVMTEVQTRKVWNWYILDQRFYTLDQRFVSCDTVPVKFSTGIYRIGQLWTLDQKRQELDNLYSWTRQRCQCFVVAKCLNLNVIDDLTFTNEENIGRKNQLLMTLLLD